MHAALRQILGDHVQQKGSLVDPERLRFDFAHFEAIAPSTLRQIEQQLDIELQKPAPLAACTVPTAFGEKLVMRIFDPEVLVRSFADLGFGDEDQARWKEMAERPNGIILVTGPTGSGKTTTLYSTLKQLATPAVNVCTIEDPIEMVEPAFNQMQVQNVIDLGFAQGVRALMRQDPDIIMIGEIRDLDTAEVAIQAALTGHLVLSTLHTNDAPAAITRLLDLGDRRMLGLWAQLAALKMAQAQLGHEPHAIDLGLQPLARGLLLLIVARLLCTHDCVVPPPPALPAPPAPPAPPPPSLRAAPVSSGAR